MRISTDRTFDLRGRIFPKLGRKVLMSVVLMAFFIAILQLDELRFFSTKDLQYHRIRGAYDGACHVEESETKLGSDVHNKRMVLVSSPVARSGSTFLGQLIASAPGSVFFAEPDFWLMQMERRKECTIEECYARHLRDIFTCSFSENTAKNYRNSWQFFQFFKDDVKVCDGLKGKARENCTSQFDLIKLCREASLIVVKTIRLQVSWFEKDLLTFPEQVKVVNLIRDPRAVKWSYIKFGWPNDSNILCPAIEGDLDAYPRVLTKFPDRFIQISYERMCTNIVAYTEKIFTFLGYTDLPNSTETYLKEHTESDFKPDVFNTVFSSNAKYKEWRKSINEGYLSDVESNKVCLRAIDKLGFTYFGSMERVRNLNISIFKVNISI